MCLRLFFESKRSGELDHVTFQLLMKVSNIVRELSFLILIFTMVYNIIILII